MNVGSEGLVAGTGLTPRIPPTGEVDKDDT